MLGVRRFKGTQIDLWQGEIKTFATDRSESAPEPSPSGDQHPDGLGLLWLKFLNDAEAQGGRHLAVAIADSDATLAIMNALKNFLNTRSTSKIKRITLVARDMPTYDALQDSLFASFEDLDHDATPPV
jgi:hypothetical protein